MSLEVEIKPLGDLLSEGFSKASINRAFDRFECGRESDVVHFLKRRAIQNEITGASKTYLVLSSEALDENRLEVVAVLTVALTITNYESIEKERRREVMGKVPGVDTNTYFPGYLIAQLARDDRYDHNDFDASEMIVFAEELIGEAIRRVGGRTVYIDCRPSLLGYYARYGYEPIYFGEEKGLYKLVKALG